VPIKNVIAGTQTLRLQADIIATTQHKATGLFTASGGLIRPFLEPIINILAFLPQFCYLLFFCARKRVA
jgi:hypothetical protein